VETASEQGGRRRRRSSPRASDDGAISLPAIPQGRRAAPSGGGRQTEEQIKLNRYKEAKARANNQQQAVRRQRQARESEERGRRREVEDEENRARARRRSAARRQQERGREEDEYGGREGREGRGAGGRGRDRGRDGSRDRGDGRRRSRDRGGGGGGGENYEITEEALEIYQQEERRMTKLRERATALDARRRQIEERVSTKPRSRGSENEWLESVAVEDEEETAKMSQMYAKNSSLAARFAAMRG
jgi:hypothetical protein